MDKHTPGPWALNEEGRIVGADDRPVGEPQGALTAGEIARVQADRRLMASAPRMLAALRAASALLTEARDVLDDEPDTPGRDFADRANRWLDTWGTV